MVLHTSFGVFGKTSSFQFSELTKEIVITYSIKRFKTEVYLAGWKR